MDFSINYSLLHSLRFAKFSLLLEAAEELHLPEYKGSTLRGGFGNALKQAVCMTKTFDCPPCLLQQACPYISIFEPKVDKTTADLLHIGCDAPQPFVLEPPLTKQRELRKGEQFTANIVLVGRAIATLPYFIYAFTVLGKQVGLGKARGKFLVRQVTDADGKNVYGGQTQMLKNSYRIFTLADLADRTASTSRLVLNFLTPARIRTSYRQSSRHLMRLRDDVNFLTMIETLYHRVFTLVNLYCNPEVQDYSRHRLALNEIRISIVKSTIPWDDWERRSNRQKRDGQPTKMKFGGYKGEATIEGELGMILPLLKIGEFLHVGSGATFGLGMYRVRWE